MLVLGITGDVGAGKSTITEIFKKKGASTISADSIAHELWKDPEVLKAAEKRWGREILLSDGSIDSVKIGSIIFSDKNEYDWLCCFLHPLIRQESERRISCAGGWIVAEIPLLFENGVPWWIDRTLYIRASIDNRVKRNRWRNWDRDEILRREKFLMNPGEKSLRADLVLNNDDPIESRRPEIEKLADRLKDLSSISVIEAVFDSLETAVHADKLFKEDGVVLESEIHEPSVFSFSDGKFGRGRFYYSAVILGRNYRKICKILTESGFNGYSGLVAREVGRPGLFFRHIFPEESVV